MPAPGVTDEPDRDPAPSPVLALRDKLGAHTKEPLKERLFRCPGDDLLSHTVPHAVPSAQEGLTAVFEMGTGVAPPL